LDFSDFKPEKIRPEKFQSKFFCDFQLSTGKFFWFLKFRGQKKFGFSDPNAGSVSQDLRRKRKLVTELTPFFPTFAPDFFGIFNFQPEFFSVFKISN